MFKLRDYQRESVSTLFDFLSSKGYGSCVLELATGAGKSVIVAEIARLYHEKSKVKGKVLCLAPSKELVEQNREKYLALGLPASIYSASAGKKCTKNNVIFGTPMSVVKATDRFKSVGIIIIDEAHGISKTIKKIIEEIKLSNPSVRVVGLTATPSRLSEGYIYKMDLDGKVVSNGAYFDKLIYSIKTQELIKRGYLTPARADEGGGAEYDTKDIDFRDKSTIERAFEGQGRLTASIISEVVTIARGKRGVMLFASTVNHANEVLASLPKENSAIITGDTNKIARESIINRFKKQELKYLVNVSVLTTGFDAPHVDLIAILRATESETLYQQIIGRGLRMSPGKSECLILDYAGNITRHGLAKNLFEPMIKASGSGGVATKIDVECPLCSYGNNFTIRREFDPGDNYDSSGYLLKSDGSRYTDGSGREVPVHHGRRCHGITMIRGNAERCGYKFSHKECECGHLNDITARYCKECKTELIDPNNKLEFNGDVITGNASGTAGSLKLSDYTSQRVEIDIKTATCGKFKVKGGSSDVYKLAIKDIAGGSYTQYVTDHMDSDKINAISMNIFNKPARSPLELYKVAKSYTPVISCSALINGNKVDFS